MFSKMTKADHNTGFTGASEHRLWHDWPAVEWQVISEALGSAFQLCTSWFFDTAPPPPPTPTPRSQVWSLAICASIFSSPATGKLQLLGTCKWRLETPNSKETPVSTSSVICKTQTVEFCLQSHSLLGLFIVESSKNSWIKEKL